MTGLIYTAAAIFGAMFVVVGITALLERNKRYLDSLIADALAQTAADFDEPTRDQIEAGWLNEDDETFGPADDAEWNAILDVIGLTHDDVTAAYRRSQQAQRMDRIREDIQVRRFREQIETWGGGAA